jgi:hypothetical protein
MNNPAKSNHPADHYAGERTIDGLCVTVNGKALPTFECGAALPPLALLHADTAAADLYPAIVEERLAKQINKVIREVPDSLVPGVACLVARVEYAWGIADQASRDKITEFLKNGPADDVLEALVPLYTFDELKPAIEERINTLPFMELSKAINEIGIGSLGKKRALYFLSQAESWGRANQVFSEVVFPLFEELDREDISKIIKMPCESGSDLLGAHGFTLFVGKVRESVLFEESELNRLLVESGAEYLAPQDEE